MKKETEKEDETRFGLPVPRSMSGSIPELTAGASRDLNVLVLDEWVPYPPDSGKRVRTWNLFRRLARRHRITLLCYGDVDDEALRVVESAGIRVIMVPPLPESRGWRIYPSLLGNLLSRYPYSVSKHYARRFKDRLGLLLRKSQFDLVHCEWTPYARYLEVVGGLPKLIMAHNIESQIWGRRAQHSRTISERLFFTLQARKMELFEREALQKADRVATVTELDAEQARAWGARHVSLVENGVDIDQFAPAVESPVSNEILFIGSLDWHPNLDALEYLLDEIFSKVTARMPSVNLCIVGRRPPAALVNRVVGCPQIKFVGEVTDVRSYFGRAAVVVVPLRIGGGSRIKILEALAMGKAVVSTAVGAEGLAVKGGVHLALAETPSAFAQRTVELLNSPEERRRLGAHGRKLVEERYSWDRAADALESAWQQVAACKTASCGKVISLKEEAAVNP